MQWWRSLSVNPPTAGSNPICRGMLCSLSLPCVHTYWVTSAMCAHLLGYDCYVSTLTWLRLPCVHTYWVTTAMWAHLLGYVCHVCTLTGLRLPSVHSYWVTSAMCAHLLGYVCHVCTLTGLRLPCEQSYWVTSAMCAHLLGYCLLRGIETNSLNLGERSESSVHMRRSGMWLCRSAP